MPKKNSSRPIIAFTGMETESVLDDRRVLFAACDKGDGTPMEMFVSPEFCKINCGQPLETLMQAMRSAIIDAARMSGNETASTVQ